MYRLELFKNSKGCAFVEEKIDTGLNKIGIMGGTFDPVHYGHLATAEAVRTKYDLDIVIFIPSGNPPHKKNSNVSDKSHRYNMTLLATANNDNFMVSSMEIKRNGYSYTVDTLDRLNEKYPNAVFYFITGADIVYEIEGWHRAADIFAKAYLVGATRPGVKGDRAKKIMELEEKYNTKILDIHVPALDISSTDLRQRVVEEKTIKYLLPDLVEKYIYKHKLYKTR